MGPSLPGAHTALAKGRARLQTPVCLGPRLPLLALVACPSEGVNAGVPPSHGRAAQRATARVELGQACAAQRLHDPSGSTRRNQMRVRPASDFATGTSTVLHNSVDRE